MIRSGLRHAPVLFLFSLVVAALALPAMAQSGSDDEYNRLLSRLNQARQRVAAAERKEQALRRDIAAADARRRSLVDDIDSLNAALDDAQGRVRVAENGLGRIQQQLEAKTGELRDTLDDLDEANRLLRARAVKVYKTGAGSLFDFVLGALNFDDLLNRLHFVTRVFRSDGERIRTIQTSKDKLSTERDQIEDLRQQAVDQLTVVERERNRVASIRGELQAKRLALDAQLKQKYSTLEDVQADKATYLRQQRELERESARIAAFLRGRTGGKATVGPGGMIWPTAGPVTSPFGWRTHPIFKTRRFHTGIDIGAPTGQAVHAAAAGKVIYTGPKGGYGNVVIVDHGGGVATLYAHLSSITAGTGATVSRGATIGRVGCTGYCTGPHLHFEVRVNGTPQNPMRWLP
jgi:murein DD-endopeptidase MepM/ murein hydrolase activator NlpD